MSISKNSSKSVWCLTIFQNSRFEITLNMSLPIMLGIIFLSIWADSNDYLVTLSVTLSYLIVLAIFDFSYYFFLRRYESLSICNLEISAFGIIYKSPKLPFKVQRFGLLLSILSTLIVGFLVAFILNQTAFSSTLIIYWQGFLLINILINILPLSPSKGYFLLESYLLEKNLAIRLATFNKYSLYLILFAIFLGIQFANFLMIVVLAILGFYTSSRIQINKLISDFSKFNISDVIIPKERLVCFSALLSSRQAVYLAVNSFQEFFPVLQDKKFIGLVTKSQLIKNIALSEEQYLRALLDRKQITISLTQTLEDVAQVFLSTDEVVLPVLDTDHNFIGLIVKEKVSEYDLIKSLEDHKQRDQESEI